MKRCFVLVELLIVLAVFGVFASVLVPSHTKARDIARKSKCIANLKQMGIAEALYSNDYNLYCLPTATPSPFQHPNGTDWGGGSSTWYDLQYPYIPELITRNGKNGKPARSAVPLCPMTEKDQGRTDTLVSPFVLWDTAGNVKGQQGGYTRSQQLGYKHGPSTAMEPFKLAKVAYPSRKMSTIDGYYMAYWNPSHWDNDTIWGWKRHQNSVNVLWLDGRVSNFAKIPSNTNINNNGTMVTAYKYYTHMEFK